VTPSPHSGFVPLLNTTPPGHPGSTAHLLREHLPGYARLEHEQYARECGSIAHARATALRLGSLFWQKRFYDRPQFVCYEWFWHGLSLPDRGVLLGALRAIRQRESIIGYPEARSRPFSISPGLWCCCLVVPRKISFGYRAHVSSPCRAYDATRSTVAGAGYGRSVQFRDSG
jgi:hypothetical protein